MTFGDIDDTLESAQNFNSRYRDILFPLAEKERVAVKDLAGHTLIVGDRSPAALRKVQQ